MSRRTTTKQAGDKVLVNVGTRRKQKWVPGAVHSSQDKLPLELAVTLKGYRCYTWWSVYYVICDTSKNREKHGLTLIHD